MPVTDILHGAPFRGRRPLPSLHIGLSFYVMLCVAYLGLTRNYPHSQAILSALPAAGGLAAVFIFGNLRGWSISEWKVVERINNLRRPYSHLILFGLLFCALILTRWSSIASPALYQDDLVYIPAYINGQFFRTGSVPIYGWFASGFVELSQSPILFRIVLVAVLSSCGVILYDLLRLWVRAPIDRFIIAGIATLTPMAASQAIFVMGSHPTIALLFCLSAYRMAVSISQSVSIVQITLLATLVIIFLVMAQFSSSVALLMSLPIVIFSFEKQPVLAKLKKWFFILAAIVPIAVVFNVQLIYPAMRKSYLNFEGWVDISISNTFSQLIDSGLMLIQFYFSHGIWTSLAIVCSMIILSGLLIGRSPKLKGFFWEIGKSTFTGRLSLVLLLCVLASALSFGPSSALTHVAPRYLVVPTFFGLSFALLVGYEVLERTGLGIAVFRIIGAGLTVLSVAGLAREAEYMFSDAFEFQEEVIRFVEVEETQWKDNAQIVMVFGKTPKMFPKGKLTWSSGFLRYATSRYDLNGLLGRRNWMTEDPIRSEDADWNGPAYKVLRNGKLLRRKMVGLMMDRPTYFYNWSTEPTLVESGFMIVDDADTDVRLFESQPGENLEYLADADENTICAVLSASDGQIPIFGPLPHTLPAYCEQLGGLSQ